VVVTIFGATRRGAQKRRESLKRKKARRMEPRTLCKEKQNRRGQMTVALIMMITFGIMLQI